MNDLATQVKTGDVLKKILQTQVTLEAGELIGVSPGISSLLHEAIKLKPAYPKPPNLVAHSVATKDKRDSDQVDHELQWTEYSWNFGHRVHVEYLQ